MTEEEWLRCNDRDSMIAFLLSGEMTDSCARRLRLFACACCRRVWNRLPGRESRRAVAVAEAFADRHADSMRLLEANRSARRETNPEAFDRENPADWVTCYNIATAVPNCVGWCEGSADIPGGVWDQSIHVARRSQERRTQITLIRDVFGNPFQPVPFTPSWRSDVAVRLARSFYKSRDFGPMPVLADALEEAGCDNPDVLAHCRGPGPHVRGCWVVDGVLGKS